MSIRDGELSMLTKPRRFQPRASTLTSDSTSIDHSISDQDFQWRELLKLIPTTISGSRDM
jgi:hypothetical protein